MIDPDHFDEAFRRAAGHEPYEYQRTLAAQEAPPAVIDVPTGAGKTLATLVPWICDPNAPRRLVYALPMRSLTEQTVRVAREALARLGDDTPVHVLMGGVEPDDWRLEIDRRAIVVGTIDMLVSRALNRGYAESRFAWPVAFGLLNNDCRWIFDEVQLMGPARTTSAQLHGLRSKLGVIGECQTVWMSATIDQRALETIDNPRVAGVVRLSDGDRIGPLRRRLEADKRIERLDLTSTPAPRLARQIAGAVRDRHRPHTRSIVVVNRVELAQHVHGALAKALGHEEDPPRLVLLHSRFRPPDRAQHMADALADPPASGTIVVSTQVIEAGIDLTSALLVTETAPFSAVVQRLGRCNRAGDDDDAIVLWLDRGDLDLRSAAPYHPDDLRTARAALSSLEGASASPSVLEGMSVTERRELTAVLRRRDVLDLFDTAPDLSGTDVDIAPYVRADDERTVNVFFRALARLDSTDIADQPAAGRDELVAVPVGAVKEVSAWTFDIVERCWRRLGDRERRRPGATLMLNAAQGGYSAERGWTGDRRDQVTPLAPPDVAPEGFDSDPGSLGREWVPLSRHLDDAMGEAAGSMAALPLPRELAAAVVRAAAVHDIGKAHPAFQEMLLSTAPEAERGALTGELWAKSAYRGGRHVRPHFRHELASALALSDGLLLDEREEARDLVRYLVAAHHGRVRMSIRPAPAEEPPGDAAPSARFALGVLEGDALPAVSTPVGDLPPTVLGLEEMEIGGGGCSWAELSSELRDRHGPFVLGFLEALVRVADWRASG